MDNHFEQSDGGDPDMFEVMRIFLPWSRIVDCFLSFGVIRVKSIAVSVNKLNGVLKLYR